MDVWCFIVYKCIIYLLYHGSCCRAAAPPSVPPSCPFKRRAASRSPILLGADYGRSSASPPIHQQLIRGNKGSQNRPAPWTSTWRSWPPMRGCSSPGPCRYSSGGLRGDGAPVAGQRSSRSRWEGGWLCGARLVPAGLGSTGFCGSSWLLLLRWAAAVSR